MKSIIVLTTSENVLIQGVALRLFPAVLALTALSIPVSAQQSSVSRVEVGRQADSLSQSVRLAAELCGQLRYASDSQTKNYSVDAGVDLPAAVAKFLNGKAGAQIGLQKTKLEGLLQADIIHDIVNNRACRVDALGRLISSFAAQAVDPCSGYGQVAENIRVQGGDGDSVIRMRDGGKTECTSSVTAVDHKGTVVDMGGK